MKFRLVKDKGAKPFAIVVEADGAEIARHSFKTQAEAEEARAKIIAETKGG